MTSKSGGQNLEALLDSGLALVEREGLPSLSFRTLAREAEMTHGEVTARVGRKAEMLQLMSRRVLERQREKLGEWRSRLTGCSAAGNQDLTAILHGYLGDYMVARRQEIIFWHEMVDAVRRLPDMADFVGAYADADAWFWREILGVDRGESWPKVVSSYLFGETNFALCLRGEPNYEIVLALNLQRLAQGMRRPVHEGAEFTGSGWLQRLLESDQPPEFIADDQERAAAVADAAAHVILSEGLLSLTHRSVAAQIGMTAAAVMHHFRSKSDLIGAAMRSLHRQMRLALDGVGGALGDQPVSEEAITTGRKLTHLVHGLGLLTLRRPEWRAQLCRWRIHRGETAALWLGEGVRQDPHIDRLARQLASLTYYGSLLVHLNASGRPGICEASDITSVLFDR